MTDSPSPKFAYTNPPANQFELREEDDAHATPAAPPGEAPEAGAKSRRSSRRATCYVTAPASEPLAESDPLLDFAPVPHTAPRKIP